MKSWWGLLVVVAVEKGVDLSCFLFVGSMDVLWSVAAKVRLEVVWCAMWVVVVVGISQEEMEGVCRGLFLVERERGVVVVGW